MDQMDRSLLALLQDTRRLVSRLETKEYLTAGELAATIPRYSGTPVAGQVAQWSAAGTLTQTGYLGSVVARYSGVPSAGNFAYWTANGTIADSGFGTSQFPRYSGTPVAGEMAVWSGPGTVTGGTAVGTVIQTIGDARYGRLGAANTWTEDQVLSTATYYQENGVNVGSYRRDVIALPQNTAGQTITIDIIQATTGRAVVTEFAISLTHSSNPDLNLMAIGNILWASNIGSASNLYSNAFTGAGGTYSSGSVSAITNGVRISVTRNASVGTYNRNIALLEHVGHDLDDITYTTAAT